MTVDGLLRRPPLDAVLSLLHADAPPVPRYDARSATSPAFPKGATATPGYSHMALDATLNLVIPLRSSHPQRANHSDGLSTARHGLSPHPVIMPFALRCSRLIDPVGASALRATATRAPPRLARPGALTTLGLPRLGLAVRLGDLQVVAHSAHRKRPETRNNSPLHPIHEPPHSNWTNHFRVLRTRRAGNEHPHDKGAGASQRAGSTRRA